MNKLNFKKKIIMIKKITQLLILLACSLNMYCAVIENTENKETTIIDI